MRQFYRKAKQIKAKLSGDGSIRIFEEPLPGCLATIADKARMVVFYTVAFLAGYVAGLFAR